MKRMRFLLSLIVLGMWCGFAQDVFYPGSEWPIWGRDLHKSHFNPNAAGPEAPIGLLWTATGGATNELVLESAFGLLWAPQYRFNGLYDPLSGDFQGNYGMGWGNISTPVVVVNPVVVWDDEDNIVTDFQFPLLVTSGGQYDASVILFDPITGELLLQSLRGLPAYGTTFGAVGADLLPGIHFPFVTFVDNFGNFILFGYTWFVYVDDDGNITDYELLPLDASYPGTIPASFAGATATTNGQILLGFHENFVAAYDFFIGDFIWVTTINQLTDGEVPTDAFDRPIVPISDESAVIAAASNSGRVFSLNLVDGSENWEVNLGVPLSGGPSIGPDPGGSLFALGGLGPDTIYLVGRSSANVNTSSLYALNAADGALKWEFAFDSTSRCTGTIDQNGVIYVGDDRGFLYAVNPDGTEKWRAYLRYPIRVAPTLANDGTLYVAASQRLLYAIVGANYAPHPPIDAPFRLPFNPPPPRDGGTRGNMIGIGDGSAGPGR